MRSGIPLKLNTVPLSILNISQAHRRGILLSTRAELAVILRVINHGVIIRNIIVAGTVIPGIELHSNGGTQPPYTKSTTELPNRSITCRVILESERNAIGAIGINGAQIHIKLEGKV